METRPRDCGTQADLSRLFDRSATFGPELTHEIRFTAYEFFFDTLADGLRDVADNEVTPLGVSHEDAWLAEALLELAQVAGIVAERWKRLGKWTTLKEFYGSIKLLAPMHTSSTEFRYLIGMRLAIRDIAIDLCMIAKGLDANALIDSNDIGGAARSPFWVDSLWLDAFVERRLPLHTPTAVETFADSVTRDLDMTVTEFPERVATYVKLSLLATEHHLKSLARLNIRRAAASLLGYGYHKDLFALEVLDSLNLLAAQGDPVARQALLDLAAEFDAIITYTDGDETDNVRERYYRAIASQFPERVGACYAHLIREGEWRYAQVLANAFARTEEAEGQVGQALLETFIAPSEVRVLTESSVSKPLRNTALREVQLKIGAVSDVSEREVLEPCDSQNYSNDDSSESQQEEQPVPKPEEFPPGTLPSLLNALRDVSLHDAGLALVDEWLGHWAARGRAGEVLHEMWDAVLSSKSGLNIDSALDKAFEVSLEAQGRSSAYDWLVRAHIRNAGWERWYSSERKAHERMRQVGKQYREKWSEFVRETAVPRYVLGAERNGIAVGKSRLVYYLMEVGETDLARRYALEMARAFKEKLTDQPLETPEWSR